jgi:folate-binding protein YgfZ
MDEVSENAYEHIRSGGLGFYEQPRGLIAVWGDEAVQFLDGLITNNVKTFGDGEQMLAAFPNAQGRLMAVVRVLRQGDRFLFETEEATREKLLQNLFRFTFAGEFFVDDLSENYRYFEIVTADGREFKISDLEFEISDAARVLSFSSRMGRSLFVPVEVGDDVRGRLIDNGIRQLSDEQIETLRIEAGIPKYGIDMDESTVVPELGIEGLISYNKGCYIGQEIIARIHFRGHVAKQLTGLVSDATLVSGTDLTAGGKNAGRITSAAYSPKLGKNIALAFVRYEHLAPGTILEAGDHEAVVTPLPFF